MKHFLCIVFRIRTYWLLISAAFMVSLGIGSFSPLLVSADATAQNTAKVSFTFDDGLSSALLAAQTLQQDGYVGTDYIITHCVGMKVPNTCAANGSKDYMSWADIQTLSSTYGWEIGSHTQTHPLTAAVDNPTLTDQQLDTEISGSKADLAAQGFDATDFASPYGDYDNRSLAVIAKYYASHRAFQDYEQPTDPNDLVTPTFPYYSPRDSYPYNNYLLTVEEVQGNIPVSTVEGYVDQAITNHQWLILVFHNIMSSGASTNEADYEYNASDLKTIADYVKSKNVPAVTVKDGLANGMNIMPDSAFNNPIGTYSSPSGSAGWTTDSPSTVQNDQQTSSLTGHGSYDGTAEGPLNSIAFNNTTAGQVHLFSPLVTVTPGITYTLTNFVNITSTTGSVNFYVDEYDANGNYINFVKAVGPVGSTDAANVQVGDVNFMYTPSTSAVAFAHVYADIAPGTTGYIDNMDFLAPAGTGGTTAPTISSVATSSISATGVTITWTTNEASTSQVDYGTTTAYNSSSTLDSTLTTTHSVTLSGLSAGTMYHFQVVSTNANGNSATAGDFTFTTSPIAVKAGDVNGDGVVNIKDATIISLNWGKTGVAHAQGDLNGDGIVNIKDATLVSLNWGK